MESIKRKFQSNIKKPMGAFLCIVTLNLLLWVIVLLFGVHWDGCDDPFIAQLLQNTDYYCTYVGGVVRWFVHQLFGLSPTVEWWMIFSLASAALGISVCVYTILYKNPNKHGIVLGGGLFLIGWLISVYMVNFTRTAMVISMGGVSLILLALSEQTPRRNIPRYICGLLLLLLGAQVRIESGLLALGFLAVGGFIHLVRQPDLFKQPWWRRNRKVISLLVLAAVIFVGAACLEFGMKTEQQKERDSFDFARSYIQDFNEKYSKLLNDPELCRSIGLSSPNDIMMLFKWMNDDPEVFTKEQFIRIGEAKDENEFIRTSLSAAKQTIKVFILSPLGIVLLIVSAVVLSENFRKNAFPVLFNVFISAALFFCLYFMGRNGARVYDSIIFAAIFVMLFFSDHSGLRVSVKCRVELLIGVIFIAAVWLKTPETQRVTPFNEREIQSKLNYENYDLINERKENIYFCLPYVYNEYAMANIWTMPPEDYCDNFISLGGWASYASNTIDKKEKYGIDNPFRDLLEKENTYLVFTKEQQKYNDKCDRLLLYLREHYDPSTVMETLDDLGTFTVIQFRSGN